MLITLTWLVLDLLFYHFFINLVTATMGKLWPACDLERKNGGP